MHGGVCLYVKVFIQLIFFLICLIRNNLEVLWAILNPRRLPRGFSRLAIAAIYHPPSDNNTIMLEYLQSCLEILETKYPNCGLILAGDFNQLPVQSFARQFQLKQIVNFPTRGTNTLDLILTNLSDYYNNPFSTPSFGLSDHLTVFTFPKTRVKDKSQRNSINVRDKRPSSIRRLW